MIDYRKHLNDEQLSVVMEPGGPMLVLAGAGTGKTRALTYRVAHLIESGVPPDNILLATFTNKAAKAMLSRVCQLLDINLNRLWGGTFHNLCHRILRAHPVAAGLSPHFSIIDNDDSRMLLASCLKDLNLNSADSGFPGIPVIMEIIRLVKKSEQDMGAVVTSRHPYFERHIDVLAEIEILFRRKKKDRGLVDFDDLIVFTKRLLLDRVAIADHYRQRFLHILVDEYQDTDLIQAQIIDLLAAHHRNLMVVGDDAQSIYAFRGANYANIMKFPERYPDCRIFKLEDNYRSTREIISLANICIEKNTNQMKKELRAIRGDGWTPILVATQNVFQQADFVARKVIELAGTGVELGDIAVLYRAHYHSTELQMELNRRGIPFLIRSGMRFFEQAHLKDLLSYARIVSNPRDDIAWRRLLEMYPGVGPRTADKVWQRLARETSPLQFVLTEPFIASGTSSTRTGLEKFQQTMAAILDGPEPTLPADLLSRAMDHGYQTILQERYDNGESREADLRQLIEYAKNYSTVEKLVSDLVLLAGANDTEDEEEKINRNKVLLSTIHQAKGLEWKCVFIIWCADGMIPYSRSLQEIGGEEEERRLFYVGVTRAQDHLYLVYPLMDYSRHGRSRMYSPSRFISEIRGLLSDSRRANSQESE